MRKEKKPSCPRCKHPGFKIKPWSAERPFKPVFECDKCKDEWAFGRDGGAYSITAMNKEQSKEIIEKYKSFAIGEGNRTR